MKDQIHQFVAENLPGCEDKLQWWKVRNKIFFEKGIIPQNVKYPNVFLSEYFSEALAVHNARLWERACREQRMICAKSIHNPRIFTRDLEDIRNAPSPELTETKKE